MERNDLINKLNALLEKTVENGCTPDEAQSAAEKVNQLLLKYNLSLAEIKDVKPEDNEMAYGYPHDKNEQGKTIHHEFDAYPEYLHSLAVQIGRLNFCEVIGNHTPLYLGLKKDCEIATHMFETLVRQIRQQSAISYREYAKAKGLKRDDMYGKYHWRPWRESYVEGACHTLSSSFWNEVWKRDHETIDTKTTALVLNKQAMAREFAQSKFPVWYGLEEPDRPHKEKEEKPDYRLFNSEAYHRGSEDGKNITYRKGIENHDMPKLQ